MVYIMHRESHPEEADFILVGNHEPGTSPDQHTIHNHAILLA